MNSIWKSRLPDNMIRKFFRATVESVLIYGSVIWTLTKSLENILNGNYTQMLSAILNIYWKDHPNNKEIYGNISNICTSIRQQRLRFSGHCWIFKLEFASDVIIWQRTHGKRKRGRPRRTYVDQLEDDKLCDVNEIKKTMEDRDSWRKIVKNCRASSTR